MKQKKKKEPKTSLLPVIPSTDTEANTETTSQVSDVQSNNAYASKEELAENAYASFTAIKRQFLLALESQLGIVTAASKITGISRSAHHKWCRTDPEYKAAVDDINEVALDFAESKLHQQIKKGREIPIIFYMKTKGKSRGYVERQEVTGKDGRDLIPFDWNQLHTE